MLISREIPRQLPTPAASAVNALLTATIVGALASRIQARIFAATEAVERLFADFAGVPYQDPTSRRHWEELLESRAERWRHQ